MQHSLLKDVNRQAYGWKVLVRLARLWEFRDQQTGTILYELDFVVVDREGGTMEGFVPNNRINQFKNVLKEGSVYAFEHFALSDARRLYKSAEHQYRIRFTQRTTVKEFISYPQNFPAYGYNAKSFDVLSTRRDNNTLLSDVVGLITAVSEVSISPSTQQNKRQIFITDGSQRAIVTLWGDYAEAFDADSIQKASANQPMVALFVGMTVGQFSGMLAFKSTSATRWYINIDIPEMATTRHNTADCGHQIEWQGSFRPKGEPLDITLTDLLAADPYNRIGERFRLKIEITDVVKSENWWYLSCKSCWKKLILNEGVLKCPRCSATKGEPRYKLVLEGTDINHDNIDEPKVAQFTFFGQEGTAVVGKDAPLLVPDVTVQDASYIPPNVMAVVGKKLVLIADLAEGSLDADNLCFQVSSSEQITESEGNTSFQEKTVVPAKEDIVPTNVDAQVSSSSTSKKLHYTPPAKNTSTTGTSKKRAGTSKQNLQSKKGQKTAAMRALSFTDQETTDAESSQSQK